MLEPVEGEEAEEGEEDVVEMSSSEGTEFGTDPALTFTSVLT